MGKDSRKFINEYTNNIYIIKRRLSELKRAGIYTCFRYCVGDFVLKIFTAESYPLKEPFQDKNILQYQAVDINLYEYKRLNNGILAEQPVNLDSDIRFKDYKPIKYIVPMNSLPWRHMPIIKLCELIKYLHKLTNLAAFA